MRMLDYDLWISGTARAGHVMDHSGYRSCALILAYHRKNTSTFYIMQSDRLTLNKRLMVHN